MLCVHAWGKTTMLWNANKSVMLWNKFWEDNRTGDHEEASSAILRESSRVVDRMTHRHRHHWYKGKKKKIVMVVHKKGMQYYCFWAILCKNKMNFKRMYRVLKLNPTVTLILSLSFLCKLAKLEEVFFCN